MIDPNKLKIGDRIGHPTYGVGVVEVRDSLRVNGPIGLRVNWDRGGEWLWLLTDDRWKEVTDIPTIPAIMEMTPKPVQSVRRFGAAT